MKIFRTLREMILDNKRSLRERVFVVLTMAALGMILVGMVGDLIYGENIVEVIILALTLLIAPVVTYLGIVKDRVELVTRLISLGVLLLIMPGIFFFGGGPEGGAVHWLIFCYLYMGLVLNGKWRVFSMVLLTIEVGLMYYLGYHYPELVQSHEKGLFYLDSALAIVEVGIICFIMSWFQGWLMREENRRVREESQKVEELSRSQSRFFSSMSHEIRTPINSILGLNEIILRQEDASEEIIRDSGNIQGAGKMLLALVNDILDISKIEAGKMEIVPVNYSVAAMVSEIVNMMWFRAEQKGLKLVVEADPFLPGELFGDEVRIKQILINLLNNAVKYTNEGSVTLHIETEETDGNRVAVAFSVTDTGVGIKQDALPYLFDTFRRVDTERNRMIEGTGLGLAIVKQLVELMDGRITVDSVYTQGSTFNVTLWQTVANPKPLGELNLTNYGSVDNGDKYESAFKAPDARILIVDDNEMNLEVEKKLLLGTDMQIDTASSGAQAISMCLSNRYDVIFMDHLMPEMDGIQCMQRLRKQMGGLNNHVPIIALTANAGSESRELYNRSGFDGSLVKPVSGRQLEETLLIHLPVGKIIRNEGVEVMEDRVNMSQDYVRKIPVLIATSTMCDLPEELLRENQIDTIPFIIRVNGKEYYDSKEVSTGELLLYRRKEMVLSSRPPLVEEFESFFGKELKKAHQLIYLTVSSEISKEYEAAREAARAYGNVYVFNSGFNSASLGMLVLRANILASRGRTPAMIIEELEKMKKKVHCSFVTDDSSILVKRGMMVRWLYAFMNTFGFRPILKMEDNSFHIATIKSGDIQTCYGKYIEYALPWHANVDTDLLMVSYVDAGEEELQKVEKAIRKRYDFKHIVFVRASAAMSLNCGIGAMGLLFMEKGEYPYQLGEFFGPEYEWVSAEGAGKESTAVPVEEEVENYHKPAGDFFHEEKGTEEKLLAEESGAGAESPVEEESGPVEGATAVLPETKADKAVPEKWYENVPGVDGEAAIRNSGSETILRSMFDIFYKAIDEKKAELQGLFDDENWKDYTIKVHALKSSARLIGAMELADEAEALEFAGKEDRIDTIREDHENLIHHLLKYKEYLYPFLPDDDDDDFDDFFIDEV